MSTYELLATIVVAFVIGLVLVMPSKKHKPDESSSRVRMNQTENKSKKSKECAIKSKT